MVGCSTPPCAMAHGPTRSGTRATETVIRRAHPPCGAPSTESSKRRFWMHCDAWTPTLRASVHYQSTTLPTRVHGVRGSLTTSPAVGHDSAPAANGGGSREGAGPAEEGVLGMRVVEGAPEADEEEEKWLGQYSSTQSILLVGDGDFSFSLALATGFGSGANLVATSLDTYGSSAFALSCLVNVAPLLLGISGNGRCSFRPFVHWTRKHMELLIPRFGYGIGYMWIGRICSIGIKVILKWVVGAITVGDGNDIAIVTWFWFLEELGLWICGTPLNIAVHYLFLKMDFLLLGKLTKNRCLFSEKTPKNPFVNFSNQWWCSRLQCHTHAYCFILLVLGTLT